MLCFQPPFLQRLRSAEFSLPPSTNTYNILQAFTIITMKHKQEEVALPKRERLTLTQLAGYDDILTDALVDHVGKIDSLESVQDC